MYDLSNAYVSNDLEWPLKLINVKKNCCFITMCKAHSKVTHIKQQKYFHHLKRPGYNTEFLLHPRPFRWWKYFLLFYMCHFAMGLTHRYKTTVFFYIYHFLYWNWYQLIFAVLEVSFIAITTVVKLLWKFLTLGLYQ